MKEIIRIVLKGSSLQNPAIEDENPAIEAKNPAIEAKNPAIEASSTKELAGHNSNFYQNERSLKEVLKEV